MKILNMDEVKNYEVVKSIRRGSSPCVLDLRTNAALLEVGQTLFVPQDEWTLKGTPAIKKELGAKSFSTRTLVNHQGWFIIRTK